VLKKTKIDASQSGRRKTSTGWSPKPGKAGRHTTKSKQEEECSTGGKNQIRKGPDAAPPKENKEKQPERHLSTRSRKSKQNRGRSKKNATQAKTQDSSRQEINWATSARRVKINSHKRDRKTQPK
jgi:hypothetical protein